MPRFALICAAFALGFLTSPVAAQPVPPDESAPQAQQPAPEIQPFPADSEPVPPIPPMPKARPSHRWVDISKDYPTRSRHHSTRGHHRTSAHHRAVHHRATHHRAVRRTAHPSRRTIRWCHRMTYTQIMRHSSCRALMKRDLAARAHRHRHASRHHSTAHRSRHHRTSRKRHR
jgi:hypothetical protein